MPEATVVDEDADQEHTADAWRPPLVRFPEPTSREVLRLSELGLYVDIENKVLAPDLIAFEPRYPLWSDGAEKRRWLRLPAGEVIDNRDPDHFRFPVGTVLFKEFSRDGKRLETRVVARTGDSQDETFMGTFLWQDDESDALLVRDGMANVRDTDHDLPTQTNCGTCHNGEPGRVLGFSAVQKPKAEAALFLEPPAEYTIPGDSESVEALGYLHGNCGHCHNPHGSARRMTAMNLRLSPADLEAGTTTIERETVRAPLYSFTATDLMLRVVPGEPDQSGLLARMLRRGDDSAMPPLGTKHVDEAGTRSVRSWILGLARQ